MLQKLLSQLHATVRDIVLAGVAAGTGVILATTVIPHSSDEVKVLLTAAAYAAIRASVAYIAALLAD